MGGLIAAVETRPRTVLAAFLAVHALVWTALPAFLYYNLPLDVIEAMTYGREWQLGYDKLPPLPWFLGEIAYRLTGHDASLYALSQAAVSCSPKYTPPALVRFQVKLRRCISAGRSFDGSHRSPLRSQNCW